MNKPINALLLATLLLALLVCSCRSASRNEKTDSEFIFHRVMAGETLSAIAKWYTGSEAMWHEIAEDNPQLRPTSLRPGDIVKVSVSLVTVHKEQPPYAIKPLKAAQKSGQGTPAKDSDASAVPSVEEAFGPK